MTKKIDRFLAEQHPPTPFLVVDTDIVADNYKRLRSAVPGAGIYYAVKANPAPEILKLLTKLGSSFDTASVKEAVVFAVKSSGHEARRRMRRMRRIVRRWTVHDWSESFLRSLDETAARSGLASTA